MCFCILSAFIMSLYVFVNFWVHQKPPHWVSASPTSLLCEKDFVSRKKHCFHLRSLPRHHHSTWSVTMEDGKKSNLQNCLGDFLSFPSLRCVFGVPVIFFLMCSSVRWSIAPSSNFPGQMPPATDARAAPQTCTHSNTYIAILRKEKWSEYVK